MVIIFLFTLYAIVSLTLYYYCHATVLALLAFLYARSYYDGSEKTGARQWPTLRHVVAKLSQTVALHLFDYKIAYYDEAALDNLMQGREGDNKRPVIFAAQPHGLFALAPYFNVIRTDAIWSKTVRPFVHQHVFALPLVRELTLALGAIDPTDANIRAALSKGESPYVVVDGARGMIQVNGATSNDQKRHEGLLRLAYDTKTLVCPVIHRGHEKVFHDRTPVWLEPWRKFVLDLMGYPFPTLWTLHLAPLRTQVLAPIDPSDFDTREAFIAQYFQCVERCTA